MLLRKYLFMFLSDYTDLLNIYETVSWFWNDDWKNERQNLFFFCIEYFFIVMSNLQFKSNHSIWFNFWIRIILRTIIYKSWSMFLKILVCFSENKSKKSELFAFVAIWCLFRSKAMKY